MLHSLMGFINIAEITQYVRKQYIVAIDAVRLKGDFESIPDLQFSTGKYVYGHVEFCLLHTSLNG